jgi:mono/diheme cytochrome c family protein
MCVMPAVGRVLLSLMMVTALMGGIAQPEDLDQGKSGAKLFAANCAHCHRSPRGLAKDRFSWTLSRFLQQHYTSGSASAEALTAFLQSVDTRPGSQPGVRNTRPLATSKSQPAPRPPAPVPAR